MLYGYLSSALYTALHVKAKNSSSSEEALVSFMLVWNDFIVHVNSDFSMFDINR